MSTKANEVYSKLKEKIIMLELAPLSEISEDELIEEFGVSRTPVREAVLKLSDEGFINVFPRKGTVVSDINWETISSVYESRLNNEPAIARNYFKNVNLDEIKELKQLFLQYDNKQETVENREYYINLDNRLHDLILQSCTNSMLKSYMQMVNDHSRRIRVYTSRRNSTYRNSVEQHIQILDAYEYGDGALIETAVKLHILEGRNDAFKYNH